MIIDILELMFLIKKRSIRNEFILWTLLVGVLPFIFGMLYIKQLVFEQVQEDFEFHAQQATSRVQIKIDEGVIKPAFEAVSLLTMDDRAGELINSIGEKKIKTATMLEGRLFKFFVNYESIFSNMIGFGIATEQGGYFQYPNFFSESGYDPRMRSWYQGALTHGNKSYLTDPYIMQDSGKMVVAIAQTVKRDDRVVGVVVAGWNIQELQKEVEEAKVGLSGYIIVVNQNNKIIISPRNDWLMKTPQEIDFSELMDLKDTGKKKYVTFEGEKRLIYMSKSAATDWNIIVVIDEAELINKVYRILWPIFITCGTMVVFILIFIFLATKRNVIEPIQSLTEGAAAIAKGDLEVNITIKRNNEFGILAQTFNEMVNRLNEYFTKIREQNQMLYKREQEFKTLVENAEDIILRVDDNLKILYANPVIGTYTSITAEDVCGQRLDVLGMPESFLTIIEDIYDKPDTISKNMLIEFEFITNKESVLTFQAHVIPEFYLEEEFETILLIIRNITKQKQLEKQISNLDRLNTVGEIAAGIAHEVRNPMTTVRGFLQLLSNKNQVYRSYYDLMIEELDRANAIITEFLSLAKNKMVNRSYANLNDIINALAPLLQSNAKLSNKAVILELGEIHNLLLDDKEIRQLIINLVRNGLEAIAAKGVVRIKTYEDENENEVVLAIADEGQGIRPEMMEKIGIPFQTTKENGVGLGLAICYRIAARHNAKISVETGESGTEFFIRFAKT